MNFTEPAEKSQPGRPPSSAHSAKPIDEAVIQDLRGKLREKFPAQHQRLEIGPGRNDNARS